MGVVYRAHDPELDRTVAIKVIRADADRSAGDSAERLRREAKAMAKLNHPNVVAVFDVGTYESQVYVALEYVPGETLGEWLQRGTHSWEEILAIYLMAGRGLAGAHAEGVYHRDFKPGWARALRNRRD